MTTAKTPARKTTAKAPVKPQDHKPKAVEVEDENDALTRLRTFTVEGVELEITLEFMTDFEFAEAGTDVEDGNVNLVPRLLQRMCGDHTNYLRVKSHLRDENGRIDLVRGSEFFAAFMSEVRDTLDADNSAKE